MKEDAKQRNLIAVIADLRETIDFVERAKRFVVPYKSELEKFLKKKPKLERLAPSEDSRDVALQAWVEAVKTNDYTKLTSRSCRILCSITEVAMSKQFLRFASDPTVSITPLMFRALLGTYHSNWRQHAAHLPFEKMLQTQISKYSGHNKTLVLWQQNVRKIIGDQAPLIIGEQLCSKLLEFDSVSDELNIPVQNTPFTLAAIRAAMQSCCQSLSLSSSLPLEQWHYLIRYLLKFPGLEKPDRAFVLASLIRTTYRRRSESAWEEPQRQLKDLILKDADFGDPRVNKPKWETFDPEARQIFIAWLSEEDLTFFFELIIRRDPHNRKPFWLKYVNKIRDSVVIIGEEDFYKNQRVLKELQAKGRRFARGFGLETSAFILDFGSYVIVEFSEVDNACFIYKKKDFERVSPNPHADEYDLKILKNRNIAEHFQTHHVNWPGALTIKLDQLRIHAG